MTAQAPDYYRYHGREYSIIALSKPIEPDFKSYGFQFTHLTTSCWRGHVCEYSIRREKLYLHNLYAHCKDDQYPEFNGVIPVPAGNNEYERMMKYGNLKLFMDYSGKIVLGKGFIDEYYIHMGFQRAWAYKEVIELVFKHGIVVKMKDHSEFVAKIREQYNSDPQFREEVFDDILKYVHDGFSLDPKVKAWWI